MTNIGDFIFSGCSSLTSVKLSNNLSSVSNAAFSNCINLTDIEIPDGVISIGTSAFSGCSNLVEIEIPDSVINIGGGAFSGCSNIIKVKIPENVTTIDATSLPSTTVWCVYENSYAHTLAIEKELLHFIISGDSEPQIHTIDGIAYYIMNGEAIAISANESLVNAVISRTVEGVVVTELRETFKNHTQLESVVIPKGVIIIGSSTFSGCTKLTSVEIADSVTNIGDYAFYNCRSLVSIELPASITKIGQEAFSHCTSLAGIKIPYGVNSIEHSTFDYCINLINVEISNSVTKIGSYAFQYCTSLENISIPASVTSIDYKAFEGCSSIKDLVIPNGIKSISSFAFASCSSLTNVNIPDSVTSIRNYAFSYCRSLANIEIPDSVKTIDSKAFEEDKNLTKVKIPTSVTTMYKDSFPTHVVLIVYEDSYAHNFAADNDLLYFAVTENEDEPEIYTIDAITYCVLNGKAIAIAADSELTDIIIPTQVGGCPVTELRGTFKNLKKLENVKIPDSVTNIGNYAFYGCTKLIDITVPNTVTNIGSWAFANSAIKNIVLPEGITSIKNNAFFSSRLVYIELPNTITSIGGAAFSYCGELTSIVIPNGVTCLDSGTFRSCTKLKSVKIPDSVKSIGGWEFYGCTSLEKIIVPNSITTIGDYAFLGCTNLRTFIIPASVKTLYADSFSNTTILCVEENSYAHNFAVENDLLYFVLSKTGNLEIAYGSGISGTVAYTDGMAASEATVSILYDDGTVKETVKTDANGKYSFTYAEVGSYRIRATDADGNTSSEVVSIKRMNVFDVFLTGETDIVLKAGWTVSGAVSPAENVTVTFADTDGNAIASKDVTDGSFAFTDIPNGTYIVKAETETGSISQEVHVFDADVSIGTLTVPSASASITGTVEIEERDKSHKRKIWVSVTLYNADGNAIAQTKTDKDGGYTFKNVPVGEYAIVAETEEMRPDKKKHFDRSHKLAGYAYVSVEENTVYTADTIVLYEENDHLTTISGKVTAQGEAQNCEVTLTNVFRHEVAHMATGKNGKYIFGNVPDGLYFITAVTKSDGMGFAVVIVRDGKVFGETDIKVLKSDRIKEREEKMREIPTCQNREDALRHKDKIAEEKRFYDSLPEKEKKQFSKEYVDRLNKLAEWIADCTYTAPEGVIVEKGGSAISGDELVNNTAVQLVLSVEEATAPSIDETGIDSEEKYKQQVLEDAAGTQEIVKYYDITLSKNGKAISSISKQTDTTGKLRITMDIPEAYRGHRHYTFVHLHNDIPQTLVDLDDDPNTVTFEVDKFSTFALCYTDEVLTGEVEPVTANSLAIGNNGKLTVSAAEAGRLCIATYNSTKELIDVVFYEIKADSVTDYDFAENQAAFLWDANNRPLTDKFTIKK